MSWWTLQNIVACPWQLPQFIWHRHYSQKALNWYTEWPCHITDTHIWMWTTGSSSCFPTAGSKLVFTHKTRIHPRVQTFLACQCAGCMCGQIYWANAKAVISRRRSHVLNQHFFCCRNHTSTILSTLFERSSTWQICAHARSLVVFNYMHALNGIAHSPSWGSPPSARFSSEWHHIPE